MKVTLSREVLTTCPLDGENVALSVELCHRDGFISVERLNQACANLAAKPTTQEDFTRALHGQYFPVAIIVTKGVHQGVAITCRIGDIE